MSIQVRGLYFGYGARPVLENIDFEVRDGEVVSLVGPNGAGKSTLLKCVNRINKPSAGTILADGRSIADMNLKQLAKVFGYVPQSAPNSFCSTVFETVLLGRRPYLGWGVDRKNKEKVFETLVAMDLDRMAMRQFNRLSGGEQQKVLMARAIAQEPRMLLLDEPTSNLDLRRQLEVLELVMGIVREKNMSVLMAIHDLNLASRYSDRLLFLKNGEIHVAGPPEDTLSPLNIRNVYGIDSLINSDAGRPHIIPLGMCS